MKGGDQKIETPMIGGASGAAGGSPIRPPSCAPPRNHAATSTALHSTTDMKNSFGLGKKDTNKGGSLLARNGAMAGWRP
jgi:hypothetical protein